MTGLSFESAGYSRGGRGQGGTSWGLGKHRAEVQGLEGPVKIREVRKVSVPPRGQGGFKPSPGLALSGDLHIHITLVEDTLVGDTLYLKCGICRSPG